MGNQVCCEDMREEKNPIDSIDIQKVVLTTGEKVDGSGSHSGHERVASSHPPLVIAEEKVIVVQITSEVKNTLARESRTYLMQDSSRRRWRGLRGYTGNTTRMCMRGN